MIYTAQQSSKTAPSTLAYTQRGLSSYTQTTPSKLAYQGLPTTKQIAFSGYKDNIEAFLFATEKAVKVTTHMNAYPLSFSTVPTVPIPLPDIIFKFEKQPSAEALQRMVTRLEGQNLQKVIAGKGTPVFTLDRPSWEQIFTILPRIALPEGPRVEARAQLNASIAAGKLIYIIDLFLRTNTYYFKGNPTRDGEQNMANMQDGIAACTELRVNAYWYRDGYNSKTKVLRTKDEQAPRTDLGDEEPYDLTPHRSGLIDFDSAVFVAKPSPKPSSTNWGPPSQCPNAPGLVFPYFRGIMGSDIAFTRQMICRHFIRLLGPEPKSAFLEMRSHLGTISNTETGYILNHVLVGIDLALQCQAQVFLLFEETVYLGFALLGSEYRVLVGTSWHEPLGEDELRAELSQLQSHKKTLSDLRERLKTCKTKDGDVLVLEEDALQYSSDVADALSKLSLEAEEDEKDLAAIISRLDFKSPFRTFKPDNLIEDISLLCSSEPFPRSRHIFIPLTGWGAIGSKEYKVFASYGAYSFSFRNAKGTEITIPKIGELDPFTVRDESGRLKFSKFIVSQKVISECLRDWDALLKSGRIRMDFDERAAGSRNHVYVGDLQKKIWTRMKELRSAEKIGTGGEVRNVESAKPVGVVFGGGSLDDLF